MAKGESGRIVVELDPSLKRRLYAALAMESRTLKDWMIDRVEHYLSEKHNMTNDKKAGRE